MGKELRLTMKQLMSVACTAVTNTEEKTTAHTQTCTHITQREHIFPIKYKPQLMSIIKLGDNASFHTSVLSLMLYPYQRLLAHQKKKKGSTKR